MTSNDSSTGEPAGFHITVQPSGRSFDTSPGEAMLAAAIRQGVGLPYGCKDGACGSCKCRLLEGVVRLGPHQSKALSEAEEAAGFVLTCCGVPHSDVVLESRQVSEAGAFAVRRMPTRVSSMERLSHDVMLLRLQLPANDSFNYHAGQYVEFLLRDGARRSYSMATAPRLADSAAPAPDPSVPTVAPPGNSIELHIRHMPGGKFTDHVFSAMKEKDILRMEGPFGSFYLRTESDKPIVLLASGTGFAPIKALLEQMQRSAMTRPATLYWGGRRPVDLYLDAWVRQRLAQMPNLRYVPVLSDALPEDGWQGRTGFVHAAVLQDTPDLSGFEVYACGAPIVIDSARAAYIDQAGLPAEAFHADAFISEADKVQAPV